MSKAKIGDIYQSPNGDVWQVVARYNEPVIELCRLTGEDAGDETRLGGISGGMWDKWRRLIPEDGQ
jgi:hypothetical protein